MGLLWLKGEWHRGSVGDVVAMKLFLWPGTLLPRRTRLSSFMELESDGADCPSREFRIRSRFEPSLPPVVWWMELAERWCGDMEARLSLRRRTSSVDACRKAAPVAKAPVRRRHRLDSSTERRTVGDSGVPVPPDPYSSRSNRRLAGGVKLQLP